MKSKVFLMPAKPADYINIYNWLFFSDISEPILGPQGITTENIPSPESFKSEYPDYFFDGSAPEKGRSYIIFLEEEIPIGHISTTSFHLHQGISELDIWLKAAVYTGKGYGTEAIKLLLRMLKEQGFHTAIIRPYKSNIQAIKAYHKAGFREVDLEPGKYYLPEFIDMYADGDCGKGQDTFMAMDL